MRVQYFGNPTLLELSNKAGMGFELDEFLYLHPGFKMDSTKAQMGPSVCTSAVNNPATQSPKR